MSLIIAKTADVPTYVEHGAADIGVIGKDVLMEYGAQNVYELIDLKIATHFNSSSLNAEIIYQALMDSSYLKHIEWLKKQLQKTMSETVKKLAVLGIYPVILPKAGIFLWCQLPVHIDAAKLSQL